MADYGEGEKGKATGLIFLFFFGKKMNSILGLFYLLFLGFSLSRNFFGIYSFFICFLSFFCHISYVFIFDSSKFQTNMNSFFFKKNCLKFKIKRVNLNCLLIGA